jgi:hypothetical protein
MAVVGITPATSASADPASCDPLITSPQSGVVVAVFTDTGECRWELPADTTSIDLLVVGGGGAGGESNANSVGGGGGGGIAYGTDLAMSDTLSITVGAGGVAGGCPALDEVANGAPSRVAGNDIEVIADGGGRGEGCGDGGGLGVVGGSGGGGHWSDTAYGGAASKGSVTGTDSITLYGNKGGDGIREVGGGGGGGATQPGGDATIDGDAGSGGEGLTLDISGGDVVYGSGGGGSGVRSDGSGGTNGGSGASGDDAVAGDGVDGTGGGGGGSYYPSARTGPDALGDGGDGVVVIRYRVGADNSTTEPPTKNQQLTSDTEVPTTEPATLPDTGPDRLARPLWIAFGAVLVGAALVVRTRQRSDEIAG